MKTNHMKNGITIVIIALFLGVAVAPCINANVNYNKNVLNSDNENFNCLIVGKTSWTTFYKPEWDLFNIVLINCLPVLAIINGSISFGEDMWNWNGGSGEGYNESASGWVWTKGSNDIKTWRGDSLWGNIGIDYFEYLIGEYNYEWTYFKGAIGFTGIRIKSYPTKPSRFIGFASHISLIKKGD